MIIVDSKRASVKSYVFLVLVTTSKCTVLLNTFNQLLISYYYRGNLTF